MNLESVKDWRAMTKLLSVPFIWNAIYLLFLHVLPRPVGGDVAVAMVAGQISGACFFLILWPMNLNPFGNSHAWSNAIRIFVGVPTMLYTAGMLAIRF